MVAEECVRCRESGGCKKLHVEFGIEYNGKRGDSNLVNCLYLP